MRLRLPATDHDCKDAFGQYRLVEAAQPMLGRDCSTLSRVDHRCDSFLTYYPPCAHNVVTFHRAFDMVKDPFQALEDIIEIGGIQRILTSGCERSAYEGLDMLVELSKRANGRIIIMPGAGKSSFSASYKVHPYNTEHNSISLHVMSRRDHGSKRQQDRICHERN